MKIKEITHKSFEELLEKYVDKNGRVNYETWHNSKDDRSKIENYIRELSNASPSLRPDLFKDDSEKMTYWINFYNAIVIKGVLDHWPLDSVLDVKPTALSHIIKGKGFFYDYRFVIGDKEMNLKDIEDKMLRKQFGDPRIHFAINCGSSSCPALRGQGFQSQFLEEQLVDATQKFVNDTKNVKVDIADKTVLLSTIFKWHEEDFINYYKRSYPKVKPTIYDFLLLYAKGEQLEKLKLAQENGFGIKYLDYDWSLNKQ